MFENFLLRFKKVSLSNKIFFVSSLVIVLGSFILSTVAAPPDSMYEPGDTLNPSCSPGDPNCTVNMGINIYDLDELQNVASTTEATGDILYYGASSWTALNKGTEGQFLSMGSSNVPEWATVDTGIDDKDLDELQNVVSLTEATGDILYFADGSWTVLNKGSEGQLLAMGASDIPEWRNNIVLDDAPSSGTASGIIANYQVDSNSVGVGACLHLDTDGNLVLADADSSTTMPCFALALESGTGEKQVLLKGFMTLNSWSWSTLGGKIYASTTSGGLTQTNPPGNDDYEQIVGQAISSTKIYFDPSYKEESTSTVSIISSTSQTTTVYDFCSNGIDDDGDGYVDSNDNSCDCGSGNSELVLCGNGDDCNNDNDCQYSGGTRSYYCVAGTCQTTTTEATSETSESTEATSESTEATTGSSSTTTAGGSSTTTTTA